MSEQKKVLFTSHVANFSKFNRPFMRLLRDQGYEVHYASTGEEQVLDCDQHFDIPFSRNPLKLDNFRAISQLKAIIDREGYDIIHTHTPMGSIVTRIAARAARKRGTQVIYTAHGFHFFNGASLLNWLLYYPVERYMARHTDTLVTINLEDYGRAQKFSTNAVYVPGVGVDGKTFPAKLSVHEKLSLRESLGISTDDFVMIYPAELSSRKRQLWLLRTLAPLIHNDRHYHVLLPGIDSLDGKCQRLAKQLGINTNIHFLGYRRDIPQLMAISDIAVSSSIQEGLPVNIMEALFTGLPVVATDCRGNRDLIQQGRTGFIVGSDDSQNFADMIELLRHDPITRARMARAAVRSVGDYTIEKITDRMTKLYRESEPMAHPRHALHAEGELYG